MPPWWAKPAWGQKEEKAAGLSANGLDIAKGSLHTWRGRGRRRTFILRERLRTLILCRLINQFSTLGNVLIHICG